MKPARVVGLIVAVPVVGALLVFGGAFAIKVMSLVSASANDPLAPGRGWTSREPSPHPWLLLDQTDAITGKTTWSLTNRGFTSEISLEVTCGNDGGYDVAFYRTGLNPDASDGTFDVSYRIGDQPGIVGEKWRGASGVAYAPNGTLFVGRMLTATTMVVRFASHNMQVDPPASFDQNFGLGDFSDQLPQLAAHCRKVTQ